MSSHVSETIRISNEQGRLSQEEIERIVNEAMMLKNEDLKMRKRMENEMLFLQVEVAKEYQETGYFKVWSSFFPFPDECFSLCQKDRV